MSTNLPKSIPALLDWANVHSTLWTTNQATIGISAGQLTAYKALVTAMNTANTNAQLARDASKNATKILTQAVNDLRNDAGSLVNVIKAFAVATNNPTVYSLAGVSADDSRSVLPPPNAPESFTTTVNPDGSLTIAWKVTQPAGVTNVQYYVKRRFGATGDFAFVGSSGSDKTFTDLTLPYGVDTVQYMVQPVRGNVFGALSDILNIQFGSVGPGLTITSESQAKMAA